MLAGRSRSRKVWKGAVVNIEKSRSINGFGEKLDGNGFRSRF